MKDVNLSRIYAHMMRFYGVTWFKVFSVLDKKGMYPVETKFDFYYDNTREVNHVRLQRILDRNIKNVNNFFFVVNTNRITVYLDYSNKNMLNLILNLARARIMKNTRIIKHNVDKAQDYFLVRNLNY
jgi:hypothetical protein